MQIDKIKAEGFKGEILTDNITLTIYSTDASAYKEMPTAVAFPKDKYDIIQLIEYARANKITLIPRTAGTSLAGQVVGSGIVVDVSKYMNSILEINTNEKWVRVQPGVVLDELNKQLKAHGLFFGPETSTSNRCMIGGMVGNNSCGAHSLIYGSTRDHTLELRTILSDGEEAIFKEQTVDEFHSNRLASGIHGQVYEGIYAALRNDEIQQRIRNEFPDKRLERRNTGYAIDLLIDSEPLGGSEKFNMCKLLAGSEGTLAFTTEIKLNLIDLPPKDKGLLIVHFEKVEQALEANIVALKHNPGAIELIDHHLLDCTKTSREHSKNRFFLEGEPGALLCVEFARESIDEINRVCEGLIKDLKDRNYGYAYPILYGSDIVKVWALRKAGLGLLANIPGDAKAHPVTEDTAVHPEFLPAYIKDFKEVLKRLNLECVFYAHIATGELHLRPVLNLKTKDGLKKFRQVAEEIAVLVKKYNGSLSGEHGDGRLRGEFIPMMIGEDNYSILKEIKDTWDPEGIFNRGKIVDTPPMDTMLRYNPEDLTDEPETIFDFSEAGGMLRMAEKCNGSADCRKSAVIGGTMCPSYQATKDENKTTRARANMLREAITLAKSEQAFVNKDMLHVLDLCLSCKGCKSECPSSVDMAKLKAEVLQHYYDIKGAPLKAKLIANFANLQKLGSVWAGLYNTFAKNKLTSSVIKKVLGFSGKRNLPTISKITLEKWIAKNIESLNGAIADKKGEVSFFVDEFTNYNESEIGIVAIKLLTELGYEVSVVKSRESGRTFLSKGFLRKARTIALENVDNYYAHISDSKPLVGVEPSALLTFKDEYPDLLRGADKEKAMELAKHVLLIDEFISKEFEKGNIKSDQFTNDKNKLKFHGHCQQKALTGTAATKTMLSIPENYEVEEIKSGCCGMAGAFGFEKKHYDLSMKIGELVLFPEVRKADSETGIAAFGTSCRQQIFDGTGKEAKHPVEILYRALK